MSAYQDRLPALQQDIIASLAAAAPNLVNADGTTRTPDAIAQTPPAAAIATGSSAP